MQNIILKMNKIFLKSFFLTIGFAFLYFPILTLIAYSFNDNKRVMVWKGFSFRWYGELFRNEQILEAFMISIKIASLSATFATLLGVMIGYSLVRIPKIPARPFFIFLSSSPLVMPEIILGLSLLLFFISSNHLIGFPSSKGQFTVLISHITFSVAFVAVIIQSLLSSYYKNIEEAAQDLGTLPNKIFWKITAPVILPSIISGWLLTFTLSLDDLVVASFTTGPGANTLPIVVFSKVRLGLSPEVNALSSMIMLFVVIAAVIFYFVNRSNVQK